MKKILPLCVICILTGCAGVASYSIRPFYEPVTQKIVCCEAVVRNGKDISLITVDVSKTGENYTLHLHEEGVNASKPIDMQSKSVSSVAGAVSSVVDDATKFIK